MSVFPLIKAPQIAVFTISILFAVINIPFVVLRFAARRRSWGRFTLSDAALLAAFICTTALCGIAMTETWIAAVGWHAFDAAVATHSLAFAKAVGQTTIATVNLWAAGVFFTKISILLVLSELFSVVRYVKVATRIGMAFALALWVGQVIACFTICIPLKEWWDIEAVSGWCGKAQDRLFLSTSIVHTISDVAILVLPVPCLWALRLPFKTRVGLILVFAGGLVATCVSIGRIWAISKIDYNDPTYGEWQTLLFTVIEPSLGIWIACAPHIRIFFSRKADKLDTNPIRSDYDLASQSLQQRQTSEASDRVMLKAQESVEEMGKIATVV